MGSKDTIETVEKQRNHPLFLHQSDTPGSLLTSIQLTGVENYAVWSRSMILTLRAKSKLGFVNGTCKKSDYGDNLEEQWEKCNAFVLSWILNSVSKELISGIIYATDASVVWSDLKERFDKVDGSRGYQLHREICTIAQGNSSVSAYFTKLRVLWDEFDALVPPPSCGCDKSKVYASHLQHIRLFAFLMGLNESYNRENQHSLSMIWSWKGPHSYESEEVEVLEALKPHSNLTCLKIYGFRGLKCLPPFGELPCLESLELQDGSVEVEYVEDSGFPTRRRFPSLRKLIIAYFDNLKGLLKKEGEEQFPVLEEMEIWFCPMFVIPTLSSVKKLGAFGYKLDAIGFSSISNLRALTSLHIGHNEEDTSLPEEMFKSLANLKYLKISYYYNLKELPTSLASLNALKNLDIIGCDALESLPEEGVKGLTSLTQLSIANCEMLQCLPEGLQHLTALTNLSVRRCPTLAKRCEKGIGQDWYKIAHIPHVFIR